MAEKNGESTPRSMCFPHLKTALGKNKNESNPSCKALIGSQAIEHRAPQNTIVRSASMPRFVTKTESTQFKSKHTQKSSRKQLLDSESVPSHIVQCYLRPGRETKAGGARSMCSSGSLGVDKAGIEGENCQTTRTALAHSLIYRLKHVSRNDKQVTGASMRGIHGCKKGMAQSKLLACHTNAQT